jgi:hypothetical protein
MVMTSSRFLGLLRELHLNRRRRRTPIAISDRGDQDLGKAVADPDLPPPAINLARANLRAGSTDYFTGGGAISLYTGKNGYTLSAVAQRIGSSTKPSGIITSATGTGLETFLGFGNTPNTCLGAMHNGGGGPTLSTGCADYTVHSMTLDGATTPRSCSIRMATPAPQPRRRWGSAPLGWASAPPPRAQLRALAGSAKS